MGFIFQRLRSFHIAQFGEHKLLIAKIFGGRFFYEAVERNWGKKGNPSRGFLRRRMMDTS